MDLITFYKMKNTELASSLKTQVDAQMFGGKYTRELLPNGSSSRSSIGGRNSVKGERVRVSRNVHANIDFSELNEVCLDVGKVDLSHTARFRNDSSLSPYKWSRENTGDSDLGKRPSKLSNMRSRISPRKKNKNEEAWKGWDSKISFMKQYGCPVVSVKEQSEVSHILVMTEDLVEQEFRVSGVNNGLSYYHDNFEKYILGVNRNGENETNSENCIDLKDKIREYFAEKKELESFLDSLDCSISLTKKRTPSRQLNFDSGNACAESDVRECKQVSKEQRAVKRSISPIPERFLGFSPTTINQTNKRARKFLDFYTKFKNSSAHMKNYVH